LIIALLQEETINSKEKEREETHATRTSEKTAGLLSY
jgi:hypothetical protein